MKDRALLIGLTVFSVFFLFFVIGCVRPACSPGDPEACDSSCISDSDCQLTCCGCISQEETCEFEGVCDSIYTSCKCEAGQCVGVSQPSPPECKDDADCFNCSGPREVPSSCVEGQCQATDSPPQCSLKCGAECESDEDCAGGEYCNTTSCECVEVSKAECEDDEDCPAECVGVKGSPGVCDEGECTVAKLVTCLKECGAECELNEDCAGGEHCNTTSCECEELEEGVELTTDEEQYAPGETVRASLKNDGEEPVCFSLSYGEDVDEEMCYQVDFRVYSFSEGSWNLLRDPLAEEFYCAYLYPEPLCKELPPGSSKDVLWHQRVVKDSGPQQVPAGRYRIGMDYKESEEGEWEEILSNDFFITEVGTANFSFYPVITRGSVFFSQDPSQDPTVFLTGESFIYPRVLIPIHAKAFTEARRILGEVSPFGY